MKRQQQNPLNLKLGDVVELDPAVFPYPEVANPVTILEFEYDFSGRNGPKIVFIDNEGSGDEADPKVLRIVRRGKARHPKNICAELVARVDVEVSPAGHGCWRGELLDLTTFELARVCYSLERELNPVRIEALFNRQTPGLLRRHGPTLVTVRRKPFGAWARRNAYRLMKTVAEVELEARAVPPWAV